MALWGNKNGLPSIKVKKVENFLNKRGLIGCKWFSLNAPGTENLLCHSVLKLEEFPLPIIGLWGKKIGIPSMNIREEKRFPSKVGYGLKWSFVNVPDTQAPCSLQFSRILQISFIFRQSSRLASVTSLMVI